MVKKTLLSLAIAATAAGLTACNTSSTSGNNDVESNPVVTGLPGAKPAKTAAIFSAANGDVPANIDLLFAKASKTDGTASTGDTSPPVTTMINDLAGFSSTAAIDIPFNGRLDADSVLEAFSVFLVELKSKEDNTLIDSLNPATIAAVAPTNPFAEGTDQLARGVDYDVEYIEQDNAARPTIRIQPKKPLDPKTKYLVIVTDNLKDAAGVSVAPSGEYAHVRGTQPLASASLAPLRGAVQGWEELAGGYLAGFTSGKLTKQNVILSYTFTTNATDEILLSMAAPENYISNLLKDTVTLEGLLGEAAVGQLVAGTAAALNTANADNAAWTVLDPATDAGKLATRNTSQYKDAVSAQVAKAILGAGAAKDAGTKLAAGGATAAPVAAAIGNWNTANADKQIPADPTTWTAVHHDYLAQAFGVYTTTTPVATLIVSAANGAGALLKDAAHRPAARTFTLIPDVAVPNTALSLPNATNSVQGMLELPQFMKKKSADATSFWKGSSTVGAVIDGALGKPAGTTPPKDDDGSLNVSYRFPFAEFVENAKVPVLVTYPTDGACVKPANGWKTIIFQHGITTDRTASLGFANGAAKAPGCFATVAMDMPTHGLDASTTDRNENAIRYKPFNGFNVAGYVVNAENLADPQNAQTPFAAKLKGLEAADVTTFAGLTERHENLALNAEQQPVPMVFTPGSESGNSGDFFINLTNMQQTRDHLRQAVMDMLNLNASIAGMDIDGGGAGDLDEDNLFFAGHSLGAITGLTYVAVNNTVANDATVAVKEIKPIKAVVLANPGAQLPKLLENSPSFSKRILPGLAQKNLTQGSSLLEKFFSVFQAPLDTVDPIHFTTLLKETNTPLLMFEMVGGGAVNAADKNTDANAGPVTGLSDAFIEASNTAAATYPSDTVVPNNANPALNGVASGKSYLAGTDPLISQLELTSVTATVAPGADNLMKVSKFKEGTHGTFSSADAPTVFAEMVGQSVSFFLTGGKGVTVGDGNAEKLAE